MSYGLLFIPPSERTQPNLADVYHDLQEDRIREKIRVPDAKQQKVVRQLARLFNTGTDDVDVQARSAFGSITRHNESSSVASTRSSAPRRKKQVLRPTATLAALDRLPGGKYHVSKAAQQAPYAVPLRGCPSLSAHNSDTPKAWQPLTSTSSSSSPSQLQTLLLECGKLRRMDTTSLCSAVEEVQRAMGERRQGVQQHVRWLQQGFPAESSSYHMQQQLQADDTQTDTDSRASSSISQAGTISSALSQSEADGSWLQLPGTGTGTALDKTEARSMNPFRLAHPIGGVCQRSVRYTRRLPRILRGKDVMDYKDDLYAELTAALTQLTRKQILCYSARIVEVGSLLRALRPSGLQAIFQLHGQCVSASALSTNPYLLSRQQLHSLILQQLPGGRSRPRSEGEQAEAVGRLLLAFDNTNTGYIRFVRLTAALLACLDPAMAGLAVSLNHRGHGNRQQAEAETVLRFLHRLYAECAGYHREAPLQGSGADQEVARMQMTDLQEMLTCAACRPEDEQMIQQMLDQALLKRSTKHVGTEIVRMTITADQLLLALTEHSALMDEFVRQVANFRAAAAPYINSTAAGSIADSISHFTASQRKQRAMPAVGLSHFSNSAHSMK